MAERVHRIGLPKWFGNKKKKNSEKIEFNFLNNSLQVIKFS